MTTASAMTLFIAFITAIIRTVGWALVWTGALLAGMGAFVLHRTGGIRG